MSISKKDRQYNGQQKKGKQRFMKYYTRCVLESLILCFLSLWMNSLAFILVGHLLCVVL